MNRRQLISRINQKKEMQAQARRNHEEHFKGLNIINSILLFKLGTISWLDVVKQIHTEYPTMHKKSCKCGV